MKNILQKLTFTLLVIFIAFATQARTPNSVKFISVKGQNLVAPNGNTYIIKGTNLGN